MRARAWETTRDGTRRDLAMNLYLCGMIGSGKTTLGRALAERVGLEFRDLDEEMDRRLGYSFHRLVDEQGWLPFRELEYEICKDLARIDHTIVALGGGTVRYAWNLDALHGSGSIVLLEADEETLIARVARADRPRVHRNTTLEQDIRAIWNDYAERYRAAADVVVRTDQGAIADEVNALERLVRTDLRLTGVLLEEF